MNEQLRTDLVRSVNIVRQDNDADHDLYLLGKMRDSIALITSEVNHVRTTSARINNASEHICCDLDSLADDVERLPAMFRDAAGFMRRQAQIRSDADARVDALVRGEG